MTLQAVRRLENCPVIAAPQTPKGGMLALDIAKGAVDLSGKTIVPFGTSGGSSMGKTAKILEPSCPGAKVLSGKVLRASSSEADVKAWVDSLHLA